jgi:hypothetical protein
MLLALKSFDWSDSVTDRQRRWVRQFELSDAFGSKPGLVDLEFFLKPRNPLGLVRNPGEIVSAVSRRIEFSWIHFNSSLRSMSAALDQASWIA